MSLFRFLVLSLSFLSLVTPTLVLAKDLYISDKLLVPVRKGQGNQFTILHKGLPSGTRVTLIERDTNWTKVSTSGGIIGWVRNQYLLDDPTANVSIVNVRAALEKTQKLNIEIRDENQQLSQQLEQTKSELELVVKNSGDTRNELNELKEISSTAVQTHQQVQTLAKKIQLLQTENDVLIAEKELLEKNERTAFFLYGAFAVLLGVLITIILPKLRTTKRSNGWVN